MEISTPSVHALVRPWRTTAIVASGIAALELLILLILATAMIGKDVTAQAREAGLARATGIPSKPIKPEPKRATLARGETSVIVLNGNGQTGAAAEAASRVRARGYPISGTGNAARSDYGRSVVMYRAGRRAEARRLARDLGIRLVGPLEGIRKRDLLGADVALVVGN
ncbi:MAG TPA: LytR C-terminal domain-containing protein [Gaiellaceae bacterium]|nr:LytR C-terminal domain-containing protein [Gaiellaceae bacterium]